VDELKKKLKHKSLMKTVLKTKISGNFKIAEVCQEYNLKRDAFYKYKKRFLNK